MKNKISKKKLFEFGLLIGITFPLLIGVIIPYLTAQDFKLWTLWISLFSIFFALINPNLLLYPYKFWMFLGFVLGWFNSRIIFGLIFFLVLLPVAIIMRSVGHDPLRVKNFNLNSYREDKKNNKVDFKKIF